MKKSTVILTSFAFAALFTACGDSNKKQSNNESVTQEATNIKTNPEKEETSGTGYEGGTELYQIAVDNTEKDVLHDIDLGDDYEKVKEKMEEYEDYITEDRSNDYLKYIIPLSENKKDKIEFEFIFNAYGQLSEIAVDATYTNNPDEAATIVRETFNRLKKEYTEQYGEGSEVHSTSFIWYYTNKNGKDASVQVKDESTKGQIAELVIYVE